MTGKSSVKSWLKKISARPKKPGSQNDFSRSSSYSNSSEIEDYDSLDLAYCRLSPEEINAALYERAKDLQTLSLVGCALVQVPQELYRCSEVRVLHLEENDLVQLSPSFASLICLQELYLEKNRISDLPESLKCCRQLRVLNLNFNNLDRFPLSPPDVTSLTELYLNGCGLRALSSGIGSLCQLRTLELRHNAIPALPPSVGRLVHLQTLDCGKNKLRTIPDSFACIGSSLRVLVLDWNEITQIPECLRDLSGLELLDLSGNYLRCVPTLPPANETHLTDVFLSDNEFRQFPEALVTCQRLKTLVLDNNYLQSLPSSVTRLTNLKNLSLRGNRLKGLFSDDVQGLDNLRTLFCDSNELTALPHQISKCIRLRVLSVRDNSIEALPKALAALNHLKILDLRGNAIPCFPKLLHGFLANLKALWIAENQTSPKTPLVEEFDFRTKQMVLTCFLLPQVKRNEVQYSRMEKEPSYVASERQDWSCAPQRLYQADRSHHQKALRELHARPSRNTPSQPTAHILPSSCRLQRQSPPPIRPYAMTDLQTLNEELQHREMMAQSHLASGQFSPIVTRETGSGVGQPDQALQERKLQTSQQYRPLATNTTSGGRNNFNANRTGLHSDFKMSSQLNAGSVENRHQGMRRLEVLEPSQVSTALRDNRAVANTKLAGRQGSTTNGPAFGIRSTSLREHVGDRTRASELYGNNGTASLKSSVAAPLETGQYSAPWDSTQQHAYQSDIFQLGSLASAPVDYSSRGSIRSQLSAGSKTFPYTEYRDLDSNRTGNKTESEHHYDTVFPTVNEKSRTTDNQSHYEELYKGY